MPCSASRVRRVFRKKNTIPRGSRFRTEAHRQVERAQKVGNTAVCSWEHRLATDATRHFDRELPVRRENIFSRRGAACGQRVTTHKMSSRRDGLKSEEKRGRRKPLASSLLSECLACHAVLVSNIFSRRRSRVRATRHDHKTSSQRAGHGQMAGARRRRPLNGSRPGKSRLWRRRSRERFPLQRARRFTNRGAETGNVNAKPRRMQPRESENAERSTRGENGRQRSEL